MGLWTLRVINFNLSDWKQEANISNEPHKGSVVWLYNTAFLPLSGSGQSSVGPGQRHANYAYINHSQTAEWGIQLWIACYWWSLSVMLWLTCYCSLNSSGAFGFLCHHYTHEWRKRILVDSKDVNSACIIDLFFRSTILLKNTPKTCSDIYWYQRYRWCLNLLLCLATFNMNIFWKWEELSHLYLFIYVFICIYLWLGFLQQWRESETASMYTWLFMWPCQFQDTLVLSVCNGSSLY